jgi:hypothetical protein
MEQSSELKSDENSTQETDTSHYLSKMEETMKRIGFNMVPSEIPVPPEKSDVPTIVHDMVSLFLKWTRIDNTGLYFVDGDGRHPVTIYDLICANKEEYILLQKYRKIINIKTQNTHSELLSCLNQERLLSWQSPDNRHCPENIGSDLGQHLASNEEKLENERHVKKKKLRFSRQKK